jgi:hypothetical protein
VRKELGIIIVGIGIEVIFFILNIQIEEMPRATAISGYIIGGLLILYGVICLFTPLSRVWEVIMSVRFRLPFFISKQGDDQKENTIYHSWLQQVLISDKEELRNRVHVFREHWLFNDIQATEPFMEVIIHIVNAAIFPIVIEDIEGSFQIQGTKCNWDATMSSSRIPHGEAGNIRISQRLLKETVDMMIKLHNERDGFMVELNACNLIIRAEEPDVENKSERVPLRIREQVKITT